MSITVSAEVWKHSAAKGSALLLLVSLADQANDEGWCWPAIKLIAERCRISERTVQRLLIQLEGSGELRREERPGSSTRYQVTVRGDTAMSPLQSVRGDIAVSPHPRHSYVTGGVTTVSPRNVSEPSMNQEPSLRSGSTRARATRLSPDWMPSRELIAEMRAECPDVNLQAENRKFIDYWCSKSGKDATKTDWVRTWRNWIRNARPTNGHKQPAEDVSSQRLRRNPDPVPPADLSPAEQNTWLREARRRIAAGLPADG